MTGLEVLQQTPKVTGTLAVTESAAKAIAKYLVDHDAPEGSGLRVGVRGGGCSGLSYFLDVDQDIKDTDKIIDAFGVQVFVDPKSMIYLQGSTLDYVTGLMESGFKFVNPNAGKGCGCGESFTPA